MSDEPIKTEFDDRTEWRLNGELYRMDGPAIRFKDGRLVYANRGGIMWINAEGGYHREDGPAIEWADSEKRWYLNGVQYDCMEWMLKVFELNQEKNS